MRFKRIKNFKFKNWTKLKVNMNQNLRRFKNKVSSFKYSFSACSRSMAHLAFRKMSPTAPSKSAKLTERLKYLRKARF